MSCPPREWCRGPARAWGMGCASYPQKGMAIVFLTGNFFKIKYFKYSSSPFLSSCAHPALPVLFSIALHVFSRGPASAEKQRSAVVFVTIPSSSIMSGSTDHPPG